MLAHIHSIKTSRILCFSIVALIAIVTSIGLREYCRVIYGISVCNCGC